MPMLFNGNQAQWAFSPQYGNNGWIEYPSKGKGKGKGMAPAQLPAWAFDQQAG